MMSYDVRNICMKHPRIEQEACSFEIITFLQSQKTYFLMAEYIIFKKSRAVSTST